MQEWINNNNNNKTSNNNNNIIIKVVTTRNKKKNNHEKKKKNRPRTRKQVVLGVQQFTFLLEVGSWVYSSHVWGLPQQPRTYQNTCCKVYVLFATLLLLLTPWFGSACGPPELCSALLVWSGGPVIIMCCFAKELITIKAVQKENEKQRKKIKMEEATGPTIHYHK